MTIPEKPTEKEFEEMEQKILRLRAENIAQTEKNQQVLKELQEVWRSLVIAKPDNRSPENRWYQVAITDIQKIIGYFKFHVVDKLD